MFQSYFSILRRYPAVIAFGFLCMFFSNFGQTFFIGLYSETFQNAWGLTGTQFGMVYGSVSLVSAFALLALGHLLDKVSLRRYVAVVCSALALGCALIAHAPWLALFVVGLFLVRFNGQGVMTHLSSTVTAREVHEGRGRGLSLAAMGMGVGGILFPLLYTGMHSLADWRMGWCVYAVIYLLVAMPLLLWLAPRKAVALPDETQLTPAEEHKLRDVLRDPALWLVLLANMIMPFLLTGIFFHERALMEDMGFSPQLYALSFTAFGVGQTVSGLLSGGVVDRMGAVWVLRLFLLPFLVATLALIYFPVPAMLPVFMLAAALTGGCTHSSRGSYLAERYGTGQLGAIKSLFISSMVFATALAPVVFGLIIDHASHAAWVLHLCWISAAVLLVALQALGRGKAAI